MAAGSLTDDSNSSSDCNRCGRGFAMPPSTLIVAPASVDPRQAAISIATAIGI